MSKELVRLEKEIIFTGEGYSNSPRLLRQIFRDREFAIYEVSRKSSSQISGYEVFKIPLIKAGTRWPNGTVEETDREYYPGANSFGRIAFFVKDKPRAEKKLQEMRKNLAENLIPKPANTPNPENLQLPDSKEFTIQEYAMKNGLNYSDARKFVLQTFRQVGVRRLTGRGKPPAIYA